MLEYIYEWMENIAFYMVLVTAVMHLLPDSDYQKYVRFFTGRGRKGSGKDSSGGDRNWTVKKSKKCWPDVPYGS